MENNMKTELKKEYQKPEVILISFTAHERIADDNDGEIIDGELGLESSIFG